LPRASASFREPFQLGAWLRALVVRRALDRHRASARRREVPIELAHEHTTSPATQDFVAERRLREAIATLPVAQRAVFLLRATEGLSHSEIAAVLGIRSGTSEVRYSRAIRSLRALLGDIR
jgi:RNA polymerase sigma-70 factor, ECF subfamily